jgi:hypothetical protein
MEGSPSRSRDLGEFGAAWSMRSLRSMKLRLIALLVTAVSLGACASPTANSAEQDKSPNRKLALSALGADDNAAGADADTKKKLHSLDPKAVENELASLAPKSGDPFMGTDLSIPSGGINDVLDAIDKLPVLTQASRKSLGGYVLREIDRRAPGWLDANCDKLADPAQMLEAYGALKRTVAAVMVSPGLKTLLAADPQFKGWVSSNAPISTRTTGSDQVGTTPDGTPVSNAAMAMTGADDLLNGNNVVLAASTAPGESAAAILDGAASLALDPYMSSKMNAVPPEKIQQVTDIVKNDPDMSAEWKKFLNYGRDTDGSHVPRTGSDRNNTGLPGGSIPTD